MPDPIARPGGRPADDPPAPGPTDPGSTDPGSTDPEATDPEATDPEATDPEATDPEATDPEATADRTAALARRATELVLAAPGVVRTEPPLTRALARLGRHGLPGRGDRGGDRVDDVEVRLHDHQVDISVDLIIAEGAQALTTTRTVRSSLITAIRAAGFRPGRVTVAVLGVDIQ